MNLTVKTRNGDRDTAVESRFSSLLTAHSVFGTLSEGMLRLGGIIVLMSICNCGESENADGNLTSKTSPEGEGAVENSAEPDMETLAKRDEALEQGRKIVEKIELYESEHGFLPTAPTALTVIPEGWILAKGEQRAYTLTKDLGEDRGVIQYRHPPLGNTSSDHGRWYVIEQIGEAELEE
jgi:hypothetical protein